MSRAASGGSGGWRVALVLLALTGVALAVTGCATNEQRSAKLEKERLAHPVAVQRGLAITRTNQSVKVLEAVAVHDASGAVVVVSLQNTSGRSLREVPLAIAVSGTRGGVLYRNNAPGLDSTLVSVALMAAGQRTTWVDDQIPLTATPPTRVSVRVGESPSASATAPQVSVTGLHGFEEPGSGLTEEGTVTNHSGVTQQKLVVYAVGRRAGHVVAAGRSVLPEVPAGQSASFQVFFIGNPQGAKLEVSAPATTPGQCGQRPNRRCCSSRERGGYC